MNTLFKAAYLTMILCAATPVLAQSTSRSDDPAALLSGAWRMVSLEAGAAGGDLADVPYSGQIVFTEAGTMSVQAMDPDPTATSPYVVNGYEATYGKIKIDADAQTFVFSVESSLARDLIGQDLERAFEVSADQLVLTPTSPDENWRVVYERQ